MDRRLFAAGLALLVGCATPVAIQDIDKAGAEQAQQQAAIVSANQLAAARELPGTPPEVAVAFVTLLAEGGLTAAQDGCLLFSPQAGAQFAADHKASSCAAAMLRLRAQVTDPGTYATGLTVPDTAWVEDGTTATVNGCALNWNGLFTETPETPGPLPGLLTLTQMDGYGWRITGYQPC